MGYVRTFFKVSAVTVLISQAFVGVSAFAAGYQINEVSPSLQGSALAGSAATDNDVSSMFINPATLSNLQENQVYVGASEIMPHISMSNAHAIHTVNVPGIPDSSITATVLGRHSESNVGQSALVPDAYIGWRLGNCLTAGLAVVGPFGLITNYNRDSVVRFASKYSAVKTVDIIPAVAFAINNKWSVGVGFQAQYLKAIFSNFNGPYTGVSEIDAFIASTHQTYLKASGWGYGYTVGVLFNPDACTRLGVGYRSIISERISGNGWQFTSPGETVPAPSQDFLFNARTSVRAAVKTPAILTISAARDIGNWTVKASAQLNFWNTFKQISIDMPDAFATNSTIQVKWRNSWLGALGADYRATCNWIVRGGVAYDQSPTINRTRDTRIPDAERVWLTFGATYQASRHWSIDGAYQHLFMRDQNVKVTQASGTNAIATLPLEVNQVRAHYKGSADIFGLAFRYSFC